MTACLGVLGGLRSQTRSIRVLGGAATTGEQDRGEHGRARRREIW
jgi:hypothetical protein